MRKLIHTLLLLQTAAALNAQDVQIEGTEGEVITLVVSGFADNEKSGFNFAQKSGGNYTAAAFDKSTGRISFTFAEASSYEFDFYENLNGCINATSVSFVIKEKTPGNPENPEEPEEPEKPEQPEPPAEESVKLEIPNIFTPNGDGINDGFHINYNIRPEGFSVKIFNRSGQNIYSSSNCDFVWDGGGQNPGTYFYIITYDGTTGSKTMSGHVMLAL